MSKLKTAEYLYRYLGISQDINSIYRFLDKPIVIADSGLLSNKNITQLQQQGYEYILGARIKNEPKGIKDQILSKTYASLLQHTVFLRNWKGYWKKKNQHFL